MKLDQDFLTIEAVGHFKNPPPGGYVLKCIAINDKPSNAGDDMITMSFDIDDGEYVGIFSKFPKQIRQLVNGKNIPYFKAILKAFKDSNNAESMVGLVSKDLDFNPNVLLGKRIGACIRSAEYKDSKTGQIKVGLGIDRLCAIKDVANIKPNQEVKKLKTSTSAVPNKEIQDKLDDGLPF